MATVVLAGGGTAGHIEPALAVARQWMKSNPSDKCIFLGTKSGLENTLVPAAGFELRLIPKVAISRTPLVAVNDHAPFGRSHCSSRATFPFELLQDLGQSRHSCSL